MVGAERTGFFEKTLLPYGLDPTSIAFFSSPGTDRLYSGVTKITAAALPTRSRKRAHAAGTFASRSSL